MVIEINKDIDRYKESVVMGLTAKQLIFSVASVAAGGGIVLLLYRYIGLTPQCVCGNPGCRPDSAWRVLFIQRHGVLRVYGEKDAYALCQPSACLCVHRRGGNNP